MEANRYPLEFEEDVEDSQFTGEQIAARSLRLVGFSGREAVPRDLLRLYLDDIEGIELKSPAETNRLVRLTQKGDIEAKHDLILANQGLVIKIARGYLGQGFQFSDLIQEGNIGLHRATEKFDPDLGYAFSTYATWWIRQAISRSLDQKARTIDIPVNVIQSIRKIRKTKKELTQTLNGLEPSADDVAAELGLSVNEVIELENLPTVSASLDKPLTEDEDGATLGDFAVSEPEIILDEISDIQELKVLGKSLKSLEEDERKVLIFYYGLGGIDPLPFVAIAKEMQISHEKASILHRQALTKLQQIPELAAVHDPENFEKVPDKPKPDPDYISEEAAKLKAGTEGQQLQKGLLEIWAIMVKLGTVDLKPVAAAANLRPSTIKGYRTIIKNALELEDFHQILDEGRRILKNDNEAEAA
jgi:RNA polymerase primary sigma factor